ncbi:MAG TPA: ATP synthase F1 subunit epsilon [Xanthobacteraceae bacterium]|nr:ATP synthase F1 subunit epsilon [Xanthobacteraceae bacterium]
MATFRFDLVSPTKLVYSGNVTQVDVSGVEGDFGVLAGHAPAVATLKLGILTVFGDGAPKRFVVLGGFAEVSPTELTVLADAASLLGEADRALIAERIGELVAICEKMAPSAARDREVEKLESFRTLERSLAGATAH